MSAKLYQQAQEAQQAAGGEQTSGQPGDDGYVDADYKEVDEDGKKE